MAQPLKTRIKELLKLVKQRGEYLKHNAVALDIYKGNLLGYIVKSLSEQLSGQALVIAQKRIPPINVLRRIIDKQSKIYANGVTREIIGGATKDEVALGYMVDQMQPNHIFGIWNSYFNLFKNGLVQPYLNSQGLPAVRVIPSDRFVPFSDDKIDPDNPTGFIIVIGDYKDDKGTYTVYLAIDAATFVYFTSREKDVTSEFDPQSDGTNAIKRVPYVYINRDQENILPIQDTDIIAMTLLIPVILTDINYAHMFQSFSIVYGINLTDKGIKWGPNAMWTFESQPGDDRKPELGMLSPSADITSGLALVANQFALWLNSKGIKPGAIGDVNGSNFSSGIAKILDEMDTVEDRNEQIPYFLKGEREFWDLTMSHMLPFWQTKQGYNGIRTTFTPAARVLTSFAEQMPLVRRGQVLDESIKELDAKLTTRHRVLKRLNPTMSEKEINLLKEEIKKEETDAGESGNPGDATGANDKGQQGDGDAD